MSELSEKAAEAEALRQVVVALENIDQETRSRILEYAAKSYSIDLLFAPPYYQQAEAPRPTPQALTPPMLEHAPAPPSTPTELDGVNEVGVRWITRNGIDAKALASIFSLNGDAIELISSSIPGTKMKERLHQVLLLLCIGSYLETGTARISDETLRETAQQYNAYDAPNFATNVKSFSAEISGSKESGYTLNQRGLAAAAELLKQMIGSA